MSPPPFTHDGPGTSAATWRERVRTDATPPLAFDAGPDTDVRRLVVVGAHPDDETLGAGGLLALAVGLGVAVDVVLLTNGEASHPHSPTHAPEVLAARRREESRQAMAALGVRPDRLHLLGLPDGGVAEHEDEVTRALVELVGDGRRTVLAAPWRHDGHRDHDAAGRACAAAAYRTGAGLLEYPVWYWHWADPADARRPSFRRLLLTVEARSAKGAAMACHVSQTRPLSEATGDEVLLGTAFLEHFDGDDELFVVEEPSDDALERLHAGEPDPWAVDSRWYERRKRDLTLALLPRPSFDRVLEIGCSTGALTEALAERCTRLVAVDSSPAAVARAESRLADRPGVEVLHLDVVREWPDGEFDLVVLSEVGYFLSPVALDRVLDRVAGSLADGGAVLLCHWRHRVEGWVLDGDDVHRRFAADDRLPPVAATYRDRDVELVLHADPARMPDPTG